MTWLTGSPTGETSKHIPHNMYGTSAYSVARSPHKSYNNCRVFRHHNTLLLSQLREIYISSLDPVHIIYIYVCVQEHMKIYRHTYTFTYIYIYICMHIVHVRWELYRMSQRRPRCDVSTFQRGVSVNLTVDMADGMGSSTDLEGHQNNSYTAQGDQEGIKEQDRLLPIANVGRIMKQILPPNAKISKEAKETMQECVSEFISFVTGEASDKCHKEKRKTVNGDDICWALSTLGFDDYAEPMRRYLQKYREMEGDRAASGSHGGRVNSLDSRDEERGEQHRDPSSVAGQFMFNAMERSDASTSRRF